MLQYRHCIRILKCDDHTVFQKHREATRAISNDLDLYDTLLQLCVHAVFSVEDSTLLCIYMQISRIRNSIGLFMFYIFLEGPRL